MRPRIAHPQGAGRARSPNASSLGPLGERPLPSRWVLASAALLLAAAPLAAQPAAAPASAATRRVIRPANAPAGRPYSPGVLVGPTLYISGQLGVPGSGAAPAGMDVQARQAMDGVGAVLRAAGLGFEHLVKCHVYLADMEDYAAMNAVYGSYFTDRVPARTTVQAAALPSRAGVEVACVAYADLAGISVVRPPAGSLPAPLGPYSPAVWAGDTLYVSGMGGQDPATKAVGDSVEAQVAQTVANIATTLKAAGLGLADVTWTQAYATRVAESATVDAALTRAFGTGALPPRGQVAVPRLPGPIRAELTFIAAKPSVHVERLAGAGGARGTRAGHTVYADAAVGHPVGTDVGAEVRDVFARLEALLAHGQAGLRDVASVTVYLSDLADMPAMNAVFTEVFPRDPPARVTIQVQPQGKERIRVGLVAAR